MPGNSLRIIAGKWGSRRIKFSAVSGLRPTPEKSRETIFNWLQFDIAGSVCLDLFAGSGALGLEALSRGARKVYFVEKNKKAANTLKRNLAMLKASSFQIINADALKFLKNHKQSLDIIFMDPPYATDLLNKAVDLLTQSAIINRNTLICMETKSKEFQFGSIFQVLKSATAGDSNIYLTKMIKGKNV